MNNAEGNILLVEDDAAIRHGLRLTLSALNLGVAEASTGEEALARLKAAEYDAVLMDLNMPGMLGLQALKEIRNNKKFSQIPIIVLTTSTLQQDRKTSYELGASCYLKKPDSFGELVEITNSIVKLWLHDN